MPHPLDTPELNLARYRIRWRVTTPGIGNPGLYLVFWGRDDRIAARAPPGWEREVIRRYPLPPVNEGPQYPLRMLQQNHAILAAMSQKNRQAPHALGASQNPSQSQNLPHSSQQTLPSGNMRASLPPQQGGSQARHQMQPPSLQQQQQQAQANAQVRPQAHSFSQGQARSQSQSQSQTSSQAHALRVLASHFNFPTPFNDPFDKLSDRSWAGLRYERNHALIASIFDPVR